MIEQTSQDSLNHLGKISLLDKHQLLYIPMYLHSVAAGFPSPADDHIVEDINLNKLLISHPTATFLLKAAGNSMVVFGINQNDILVVDKSLTPKDGKIIVAAINGELIVRKLKITKDEVFLISKHQSYPTIKVEEGVDNVIWGVVTNVIHNF